MKDKDTPLRLVRLWPKMMAGCYETLDRLCRAKADGEMDWPDYCLLPINAAFTYLCSSGLTPEEAAMVASELTACWAWRKQKIIYAFDPSLTEALAAQAEDLSDSDELPVDLLLHLPYPVIYIKAPGLLEYTDGFWVWADFDTNREASELRVQWLIKDMSASFPQVIHLIPGATLGECIRDTVKTSFDNLEQMTETEIPISEESRDIGVEAAQIILQAIQLVLYLTAANADIEETPNLPPLKPVSKKQIHPEPKAVSKIQDKAGEIKSFDVGIRVGSALRRSVQPPKQTSESDGTGAPKRPHARRGHWHHYWTGPREGERTLILKWTAPTVIHPEQGIENNVVVFPVK